MFPSIIVYEYIVNNRGVMSSETKREFMRTGLILGAIALLGISFYVCHAVLHLPFIWAIVAFGIIGIAVGIFIFRFVIFDEDAKLAEYDDRGNESFARFLNVRSDVSHPFTFEKETYNIYEKLDGKPFVILEVSFGANDEMRARNMRAVFKSLARKCCDYNFTVQCSVLPENFSNNENYQNYLNVLNTIESQALRGTAVSIAQAVLEETESKCNVNQVYFTLTASTMADLYDMQRVLPQILDEMLHSRSAVRSCKALSLTEILEFYKRFYHVPVIDHNLLQSSRIADNMDKYVRVCSPVILKGERQTYNRLEQYLKELHGIKTGGGL